MKTIPNVQEYMNYVAVRKLQGKKDSIAIVFFLLQLVLICMVYLFSARAAAQTVDPDSNNSRPRNQIQVEGRLFTVQISKGSPMRIFVLGKEEAKLDLSNLNLVVRRLKPYPGKVLKIDKDVDSFIVNDPKEFEAAHEIEIVTNVKDKAEVLKLDLRQD